VLAKPLRIPKMRFLRAVTVFALAAQAAALSIGGKQIQVERESDGLQNIVDTPNFTENHAKVATNIQLGYLRRTLFIRVWRKDLCLLWRISSISVTCP
jgi:hypothetical protein